MQKIIIASDSTCDLSLKQLKENNIFTIPLYVNLGESSFKDGIEIKSDDIFRYYDKTSKIPKTSAPSEGDFIDFFNKIKNLYKDCKIIYISISSHFSVSGQTALTVASRFKDIEVIDGKSLSTGTGILVMYAADLVKKGLDFEDIVKKVKHQAEHNQCSFVINTLEYLHKGGRCSSVAVLGANLLKLKPCIEVKEGKMNVGKKYRGKLEKVLEEFCLDKFNEYKGKIKPDRIFITHTGVSNEIINYLRKIIKKYFNFKEIIETRAGCVITSHCGQETLGFIYMLDE